ncbi:hypothetical protein [Streptomyces triculaminicus]|uniref:hypothetical protein n=1 Tax=Streptomyces triculaminicus TaxID=2816232 RepID=UPI00378E72BD
MVQWCGNPAAADGPYYVEWTIDEEIVWGRNASPAALTRPRVSSEGSQVCLRGRLVLEMDGVAVLELAGSQILLDTAGPLPTETDGTWVELHFERDHVTVYPYEL